MHGSNTPNRIAFLSIAVCLNDATYCSRVMVQEKLGLVAPEPALASRLTPAEPANWNLTTPPEATLAMKFFVTGMMRSMLARG